jgi:hypothetical protein
MKATKIIEPPKITPKIESESISPDLSDQLQRENLTLKNQLALKDPIIALWEIRESLNLVNKTLKDMIRILALANSIEVEEENESG